MSSPSSQREVPTIPVSYSRLVGPGNCNCRKRNWGRLLWDTGLDGASLTRDDTLMTAGPVVAADTQCPAHRRRSYPGPAGRASADTEYPRFPGLPGPQQPGLAHGAAGVPGVPGRRAFSSPRMETVEEGPLAGLSPEARHRGGGGYLPLCHRGLCHGPAFHGGVPSWGNLCRKANCTLPMPHPPVRTATGSISRCRDTSAPSAVGFSFREKLCATANASSDPLAYNIALQHCRAHVAAVARRPCHGQAPCPVDHAIPPAGTGQRGGCRRAHVYHQANPGATPGTGGDQLPGPCAMSSCPPWRRATSREPHCRWRRSRR